MTASPMKVTIVVPAAPTAANAAVTVSGRPAGLTPPFGDRPGTRTCGRRSAQQISHRPPILFQDRDGACEARG